MKKNQQLDENLKLIAKSSFVMFIGLFLSKIFLYFYRIIIARHFGAEVYGLFCLSLMIISWFTTLFSLGINEGLLRYIAFYRGKKEIHKAKYVFRFSTSLLFFSGLISGIIMFLLSEFFSVHIFHNSNLIIFLKIFSILVPLAIFSYVLLSVIKAYEQIGWYSFILNIFQNFVKVIVLIILIAIGFKTNSIIFSYFIAILAMLLASFLFCKYKLPEIFERNKLSKNQKKKISKQLLSYSIPLMFSGVLFTIFSWMDSFFVGFFKNAVEVGIYNAAVPIALLLSIAPILFTQLFFPMIVKEYSKKNIDLIKELSKQVTKWIFIVNFPLFILLILFPGAIINILFGTEYLVAENTLRFLAFGTLISSISIISPRLIEMLGKSKIILIDIVLALFLNVLLNYFLIPMENIFFIENSLGINGAAIATMISIIFLNFLFLLQSKHYLSVIPLRRKMLGILLISIIPTFTLFYLKKYIPINFVSLILLGSFFVFSYILLILITGCLDKNDILVLKSFKRKIVDNKNKSLKEPVFLTKNESTNA